MCKGERVNSNTRPIPDNVGVYQTVNRYITWTVLNLVDPIGRTYTHVSTFIVCMRQARSEGKGPKNEKLNEFDFQAWKIPIIFQLLMSSNSSWHV